MLAIFWPIVMWLLREVVVKFLVFTVLFALVAFLVPYAVQVVAPFISTSNLSTAFSGLGAGVWWWLDAFNVGVGLPLLIAAFVARFLIRRLPVIG